MTHNYKRSFQYANGFFVALFIFALIFGSALNTVAWSNESSENINPERDNTTRSSQLAGFTIRPVQDPIQQGDPLEVEFVDAVDMDGNPYSTSDGSFTNIDIEHPYDEEPRRFALAFEDGEGTSTFELLDEKETETLNPGIYEDLQAWDVNNVRVRSTYDIEIVTTRLAEFTIRPVQDPIRQGDPLEVEFVDAVDINGDPYTTGDDSFSNFDIEHPYDDDPRRVAIDFEDGEGVSTFELLDGDETETLDPGTYQRLQAWDISDNTIRSTYDFEVVATRLAEFTIRPVQDPIRQGDPLEVEFVDAVDINGDPYTTGDDSFSNFDIEHPYDDDPRRVAIDFEDGEGVSTFELLDGDETETLDPDTYEGFEAWDISDASIRSSYDIEIVATRLAEFTIRPVQDPIQQGDPLEVEFVDAVDINGDPYTTGDDRLSNFDIEHPYDDDPRRVAIDFEDGEGVSTFELLDGDETETLDPDTYEGFEAWDISDASIRSSYDIEIVATRLAEFTIRPVQDPIQQGDPLEVEFVDAVDINGDPYTTGDDRLSNFDIEHPYDDDPRRVAIDFEDGEGVSTFELLDGEETETLDPDTYEGLEAWEVNDTTIRSSYDIQVDVKPRPFFEVSDLDPEETEADPEEQLTITADVINTGNVTDVAEVVLLIDEDSIQTKSVELEVEESATISFEVEAPSEPGEYEHTISTGYDEVTGLLHVIRSTSGEEMADLPEEVSLGQNYPNPFNPVTTISYKLPETTNVEIRVYNTLGQEVTTLVNEQVSAGHHETSFDASTLTSGIYIYRLYAGDEVITRQMTLVK
ncbi:T9SS type A sorting domain-containing protein [Natronogracilivirga saccharolytica]|uniref:T9SS type A sorting domain-containing protein n=1 Tax=Natronogracilivirga saccharolytica TaxID=2812953 RepID=A0A8J7RHC8_9BACT|nr:T9SS type A sorting domain-containing protein [Natronogracilivirga saccharolytica]MBP3191860.1 T9SS type A sorting domain-containing protein [Natronogracilivirga saccharolytica]